MCEWHCQESFISRAGLLLLQLTSDEIQALLATGCFPDHDRLNLGYAGICSVSDIIDGGALPHVS